MTTTSSYSPSVNIKRDHLKELDYIPTPNSQDAAASILSSIGTGQKAHVIVGAYGSGKSMFLWALARTLTDSKNYFTRPDNLHDYQVVNVVGTYGSIRECFAGEFNTEVDNDQILDEVYNTFHHLRESADSKKTGLLILVDEFGKFLEYAAKHNPEEEMYFLQELAEMINDPDVDILLVATLHQNFAAYGFALNDRQRNEWSKVQGRFHEVTFNEPVEQLLFLASESLPQVEKPVWGAKQLFAAIKRSRSFPLRDYMTLDIASRLFPLDILAAGILTMALQRYGQNERSLFSFLGSSDRWSLIGERPSKYYNLADVYDYLRHNFSILSTRHNPNFAQWASIATSLERLEGGFDDDLPYAERIVKSIGLLSIFGAGSMIIDDKFLTSYGKQALGIKDPQAVVDQLVDKRIIRYTNFNRRYVLFDGTDLDITLAINEAGQLVEQVRNVVAPLREYFSFQVVAAKAAYYRRGTPRFFEYQLTESPSEQKPTAEIDGFVNLVFSDSITADELKTFAAKSKRPILYGLYENTTDIQQLIFEIRKIEKVIEHNQDDRVAIRELKSILEHQKRLLNHYVLDNMSGKRSPVRWIDYAGEHIFTSEGEFNQRLSQIIDDIYNQTPVYSSELINRTKITGAIRSAHRKFLSHLLENSHLPDWGFKEKLFPPEKTIFLSLVKDKGFIHRDEVGGTTYLGSPTDNSFEYLWEESLDFISSTKAGRRSVRAFMEQLMRPPLKMKYGFLQFWMPLVLYINRNDFALYEGDAYIPNLSQSTLELILRHPHKYAIKAFHVDGVDLELFNQYRELLNQRDTRPTNDSLIETIRPFLTFYRGLSPYAKETSRLSSRAQSIRQAIAKAKDPEALFFKDLPAALGYSKNDLVATPDAATSYVEELQNGIKEVRTALDKLIERFQQHVASETGHEEPRKNLAARYQSLNMSLLSKKQTIFYKRLVSDLDDASYFGSLAQSLIGKSINKLTDEDEPKLYKAFSSQLRELDNVTDISAKAHQGIDADELLVVDLQDVSSGRYRQVLHLSSKRTKKVQRQKDKLLATLGKNKEVSIGAVAQLLKDLLNE